MGVFEGCVGDRMGSLRGWMETRWVSLRGR